MFRSFLTLSLFAVLILSACNPKVSSSVRSDGDDPLRILADELAHKYIITDGHVDLPYRLKIQNFRLTKEFVDQNPNTTLALTKALIRAARWLDENDNANRMEAVEILSRPEYVGADAEVIANSMTGTFEYEKGDKRDVPDFNVFYRYYATYPYYSDAVWYLTQMRRWGQIAEQKDDGWYDEVAKKVYRPDIYLEAAKMLVEEGLVEEADFPWDTDGYRAPTPAADIIDGIAYDGRQPNAYLDSLSIGLKSGQTIKGNEVFGG